MAGLCSEQWSCVQPHGIPSLQAQPRICVSEVPSCRHRQLTRPGLESTCHLPQEARPQAAGVGLAKDYICARGAHSFLREPLLCAPLWELWALGSFLSSLTTPYAYLHP